MSEKVKVDGFFWLLFWLCMFYVMLFCISNNLHSVHNDLKEQNEIQKQQVTQLERLNRNLSHINESIRHSEGGEKNEIERE